MDRGHIVTARLTEAEFRAFREARESRLGSVFRRGGLQCIMIAFAVAHFDQMWDWWHKAASERMHFADSVARFLAKVSDPSNDG